MKRSHARVNSRDVWFRRSGSTMGTHIFKDLLNARVDILYYENFTAA
jgi:hypothetical protein